VKPVLANFKATQLRIRVVTSPTTSTHSDLNGPECVISNLHGLSVADLVVVAPCSIPIATSGKVRRAACVEQYRQNQFARLDAKYYGELGYVGV
jgi:acyl-CoA synthetase (AMP-forming)/AMP-acid ligase II